jgi:outer membrane beta-barrel protein
MKRAILLLVALLAPSLASADGKQVASTDGKQVAAADDKSDAALPGTTAMCIDQEIADRLAIKRKRRGAVDRLFVKQGRHEITLGGGYYASDLLSGTYLVGGSYTYHMTDETAVEFAGWWTHANADLIRALEDMRGVVLTETYARMIFAESLLVWSPVYGKLRLGGSIFHFDLHADVGVGVIDSKTSRGAAGVVGFGIRLFAGQAVAFRIDARNRTFRQDLLEERFLVNDAALTAGLSLFLPFSN